MLPAVFVLLACPRPVPEHLRLEPSQSADAAPPAPIADLPSALAAVVGADPLARSPRLPDPNQLEEVAGGEPLAAFVRQVRALETGAGQVERTMQAVEDEWRGTGAVPLARGYRLRVAENVMANGSSQAEDVQKQLILLVTPLAGGIADPTLPRLPLAWLGDAEPIRAYAERWVLESWLGGPDIPLQPLVEPLKAPQYDPLRESPVGRLVMARATASAADEAAGLADLRRATALAVLRAAADRDAEQAAWAEKKKAAAEELGDPDPVGELLERAADGLTPAAGSDKAAGGALLSLAALRWIERCDVPKCPGLDRVETMRLAAGWDPEIAALSAAWQVVALKEAVDSLEVGRDTVVFPDAMLDLADALIGTDAQPIEAAALRKQRPDGQVWLTVSRSVGAEATDWEGARVALGRHLAEQATRAAARVEDPEVRAGLERIASRAIP